MKTHIVKAEKRSGDLEKEDQLAWKIAVLAAGAKDSDFDADVVDMIKNNEITLVINTVEEKRSAIVDSRAIRTSALQARATTYTTIAGAEAAVQGMRHLDELNVYDLQGLHKTLH